MEKPLSKIEYGDMLLHLEAIAQILRGPAMGVKRVGDGYIRVLYPNGTKKLIVTYGRTPKEAALDVIRSL